MSVSARSAALIATTCPTCGTVRVTTGVDRWTIPLTSPTRMDQRIIPIVSYGFLNGASGTVDVEVLTEGRPVIIDGLLATRIDEAPPWADGADPPVSGRGGSTASVDAVSAGANHSCAITTDGSLACWGSDALLQSSAPAGSFAAVSAGEESSCGIRADGTIVCWGEEFGPADEPPFAPAGTYSVVSAGEFINCAIRVDDAAVCWHFGGLAFAPDGTFQAISVGGFEACAIRVDGTLACWNDDEESTPAPDGAFTEVSVGLGHACAVHSDGQLTCWGSNIAGQATPPEGTYTAVGVGELFSCALRTDGTVACWGDDHYLQSSAPGGTFTSIDAGRRHACAIPTDGGIVCWGQDRLGQVTPRPTAIMSGLASATVDAQVPVAWRATSLAPIVAYDVRYRRVRLGTPTGPWTAWRTGTTAVNGSLPLAAGRLTCVGVRARDGDGRGSFWSNEQCTSTPFDDRSLGRSGRWHQLSNSAFYRGTALRTSSHGARLTLAQVPDWARISLVATTCPTCGTVRISWGWGAKTISLYSESTQHRQVIRFRNSLTTPRASSPAFRSPLSRPARRS